MLRRVILSMTGLLPVTCCLFRYRIPLKLDDAALMHSRRLFVFDLTSMNFSIARQEVSGPETFLISPQAIVRRVYPHSSVSVSGSG